MASYSYSISGDTATGAVDVTQLWGELESMGNANPGTPALTAINGEGDVLLIHYASALSNTQQQRLTNAVGAHTPAAPVAPSPTMDDQVRTIAPTPSDDETMGFEPKSRWLNITTQEEHVCTDAATGAAVWKLTTASGSTFGQDWQESAISSEQTTTSSSTFVTTTTSTISATAGRRYLINWGCQYWQNDGDKGVKLRLDITDPSGNTFDPLNAGNGIVNLEDKDDWWHITGGFYPLAATATGTWTVVLKFASGHMGRTARVKLAQITSWRVA